MSTHPTERPPRSSLEKISDNRLAVESMLDRLPLRAATIVARPDAVHITVTDPDELEAWLYQLGGEVRPGPSVNGASLWTLYTGTPTRGDGSIVLIRVHVPVVDGEHVLVDVRQAVRS